MSLKSCVLGIYRQGKKEEGPSTTLAGKKKEKGKHNPAKWFQQFIQQQCGICAACRGVTSRAIDKLLQFLKKSDCDEFNWQGDTYYTLLNSSLLFLAIGLILPVAAGVASYEYFYPNQLVVIKYV